jgi:sortase A
MKTLGNIFAALGLLLLGYWTAEYVSTRLYQAQEQRQFARELSAEPRASDRVLPAPKATPQEREPGSAIAKIEIPRLGMSALVVEGADGHALKRGPGHIAGTAMPGEGGNVGMAGHRDTFFRPLRFTRNNDAIDVTTRDGRYRYKVVSTEIVTPADVHVLYPTGRETLTLITCYPFDFVGAAPQRFVVRAECAECPRRSPMETIVNKKGEDR